MKELQEILKKISEFAPGERAILATVVDVVGSGYRRPGARMLIDENGYAVGTVSGGCLEADVLERAKGVLSTNHSRVITYDTTKDENSVFGLGMGCRGVVRVLLEPVWKENPILKTYRRAVEDRQTQVVATLILSEENEGVGNYIVYDGERFDFGYLSVMENSAELKDDCREVFKGAKKSLVKTYETEAGAAEFFIEQISAPLNLLLFGAGFDALPLVKFAKELGWRVTAIDHRSAFAKAERLAEADAIIVSGAQDLSDDLFADENSVAVVMTHNYDRDREILRRLLHSNCLYVGALGPKKRTEKLLAEIAENFTGEQLAKLHAPVGLDIGADTPEAIALAIVAEIQAVLNNRDGGFLRNRIGSIYGRNSD